jgi:hypothetical protein
MENNPVKLVCQNKVAGDNLLSTFEQNITPIPVSFQAKKHGKTQKKMQMETLKSAKKSRDYQENGTSSQNETKTQKGFVSPIYSIYSVCSHIFPYSLITGCASVYGAVSLPFSRG